MNTPIRCDLPKLVHDELKKQHGTKKANAERILIEWAKRQNKKDK